ncbi:MFS transporter [Mycoplasmatota bacterium WC44]
MNKETKIMLAFYAVLSFGMNFQHVVTPKYLIEIGLEDNLTGFIFAFMALGFSVSSPFSGKLGDKYGTKLPIFIGLVGYGISQILFGYYHNIYILVLVRLLAGLSVAGALTNTLSYVTKTTNKELRAKAMSYYVALSLLSIAIAYKVGGVLGVTMPVRNIFYLQGVFVIFLAFVSVFIPNYKSEYVTKSKISFKQILTPRLVKILIIYFLVSASLISTSKFLELYITNLGYSTKELGDYIFITGILSIVMTLIILPMLTKVLKEISIMKITLFVSVISLGVTFNFFNNIFLGLYTVYLLFIMSSTSYNPMHNSYISKISEENQGQIIGISQSVKGVGMFIGPILSGFIYAINPKLVFNTTAFLILIALMILIFEKGEQYES